jgi:hypothetical protein
VIRCYVDSLTYTYGEYEIGSTRDNIADANRRTVIRFCVHRSSDWLYYKGTEVLSRHRDKVRVAENAVIGFGDIYFIS